MLHLCQHHLHQPRLDDKHNDVSTLHSRHVVGSDVQGWIILLELRQQCLVLVSYSDVVYLSTFCPPFDERAAHIASANDS